MTISEQQFQLLYTRYTKSHPNFPKTEEAKLQLRKAVEFIELYFGEEQIPCAALASADENTFLLHKESWALACRIFNESITSSTHYQFDQSKAELVTIAITQKLNHTSLKSIHGSVANLGLREKLLRGNLSNTEWLTDIDLHRMLDLSGTSQKIHITTFDAHSLGTILHFEREKNKQNSQPYTIPLLLNKGSSGGMGQGVHWLAATLVVNPVAHTISYEINDSMALSADQKKSYEQTLLAAIKYNELNPPHLTSFIAYPQGWTITGSVTGSARQKDGYTCGYRALHTLFQNREITEDHPTAKRYAETPDNSKSLVTCFYEIQLENLNIQDQVYNGLNHHQRKHFKGANGEKKLDKKSLKDFLSKKPESTKPDTLNSIVIEAINKLDLYSTVSIFPSSNSTEITALNYEMFFQQLYQKLNSLDLALKILILSTANENCLDGLNAYCNLKAPINAERIQLNIDASIKPDIFIAKLKLALTNLSDNYAGRLVLNDKDQVLKEKHWQEITAFIKKSPVSFSIDLPLSFQNSAFQKIIDETTSTNLRIKNSTALKAAQGDEKKSFNFANSIIRTRPRVKASEGLTIDVELQQEVQVEAAIEVEKQMDLPEINYEIRGLDLAGLKEAIVNGTLSLRSGANLLTDDELARNWHFWLGNIVVQTTNEGRVDALNTPHTPLAGAKVYQNLCFTKISINAAEQLLNHRHLFHFGVNPENLPKGFIIVPDTTSVDNYILHYDINAKENKDSIAPVLRKSPTAKPLSTPVFNEVMANLKTDKPGDKVLLNLWTKINHAPYSRAASNSFRRWLPNLMSLTSNQLTLLFNFCTDPDGKFNPKNLNYVMKNHQKIIRNFNISSDYDSIQNQVLRNKFHNDDEKINELIDLSDSLMESSGTTESPVLLTLLATNPALLQQVTDWAKKLNFGTQQLNALLHVYSDYAEEGLTKLFEQWSSIDPELLKHLHNTVFSQSESFVFMLQDERTQNAIKTIQGFSLDKNKLIWWSALLEQHYSAVGSDDLLELAEAFALFSKKIGQWKLLSFYPDVAFENVKSLPTALSRMLILLNNCKDEDRETQWQCISSLSLQSNAAIRSQLDAKASGKSCRFVIPEMQTLPLHYYEQSGYQPETIFGWMVAPQIRAMDPKEYCWMGEIKPDTEQDAEAPAPSYVKNPNQLEEVRIRFYRYLAHQKHRLPLSFYQEMDERIQATKFKNVDKAHLYSILATSTSGLPNGEIATDAESRKLWGDILDKLDNLSLMIILMPFKSQVRNELIRMMFKFVYSPSLPFIKQQFYFWEKHLKNMFLTRQAFNNLDTALTKTEAIIAVIDSFNKAYEGAYFKGMKFYESNSYDDLKEPLFFKHMEVVLALFKDQTPLAEDDHYRNAKYLGVSQFYPTNIAFNAINTKQLLSLVSLFGLANGTTAENVARANEIEQKFKQALNNEAVIVTQAMDFLSFIERREPPELTYIQLNQFLDEFTKPEAKDFDDDRIQAIVEHHFKPYFPVNFFEQLQSHTFSPELVELLEINFSSEEINAISTLLSNYSRPNDGMHYLGICNDLIRITEDLSSVDRLAFLTQLSSPLLVNGTDIEALRELLHSLKKHFSVNEFLYFINKATQFEVQPVVDLMKKAQWYLNAIPPVIGSFSSTVLSRMHSINLIIDLILSVKPEQYDAPIDITRPEDGNYEHLMSVFENIQADEVDRLSNEIQTFLTQNPGVPFGPALTELQEHLLELNSLSAADQSEEISSLEAVKAYSLSLFNRFQNFLGFASDPEPITEEINKPQLINADFALAAKNELATIIQKRKELLPVVVDLFKVIYQSIEKYSGDKYLIANYLKHFLTHNYSLNDDQVAFSWNSINQLNKEFLALDDKDIVRSLCTHFTQEDGEYTQQNLIKLLVNPTYIALPQERKNVFLSLLTNLMNNNKGCTIDELTHLMSLCQTEGAGDALFNSIQDIYQSAPFPTLDQLKIWVNTLPEQGDLAAHLKQEYIAYDKAPCAREETNGFDLVTARAQADQMTGVHYTDEELLSIDNEIKEVSKLTTKVIKQELADLRAGKGLMLCERLVALTAELLYRTKGMPAQSDASGVRQLGRSFEINTTQYLAIHSMLKSGNRVTSEIGTGEGKSRIMMIMIACNYACGKTVDFVTSDMQLAKRDYLAYKAFFQALGAKTNLIYQHTDPKDYVLEGINFSDAANLNLFRNKARSEGLGQYVIAPKAETRALMLDEADTTYFDCVNTRFNYSAVADKAIQDMPWVYDLLIKFFLQDNQDIRNLYYDNVDACNELLLNYAFSEVGAEKAKRLSSISTAQLETWQQSALTALELEIDRDFVIKSNIDLETGKGPKTASQSRLIVNKREDHHSKFSFGLHHCLNARLNRLKNHPELAKKSELDLAARLQEFKFDFFIDDEKQIIYSSTSKSMLDEYQTGAVYAVTGTAGSIKEIEEAKTLYASKDDIEMTFLTVPRHFGLRRKDLPIYLAANQNGQFERNLVEINEAKDANEPTIIFCKDDRESMELLTYLKNNLPADQQDKLVRISAETDEDTEAHHIEQLAGQPGMITVATSRMGRGTDILLHGEAKKAGLRAIINYLPNSRDAWQMLGRAGRLGANGKTRFILNKEDLKLQLGKTTLTDGFYTATDTYIKRQQALMERKSQVERLIKYTVGDFRKKLTNNFFDDCVAKVPAEHRTELNYAWKKFFDETDKRWLATWPAIQREIGEKQLNVAIVNQHLDLYQQFVQSKWTVLSNEIGLLPVSIQNSDSHPVDFLLKQTDSLCLSDKTLKLLQTFNIADFIPLKTPTCDRYDPAHDGRAVLYTRSFEKIRAVFRGERAVFADFRAWYNGRGILFPNIRAWFSGAMTFKELLFGTSVKPVKSPLPTPTSTATMQNLLGEGKKEEETNAPVEDATNSHSNPTAVSDFYQRKRRHSLPAEPAETPRETSDPNPARSLTA